MTMRNYADPPYRTGERATSVHIDHLVLRNVALDSRDARSLGPLIAARLRGGPPVHHHHDIGRLRAEDMAAEIALRVIAAIAEQH
jgi:hypothetical protein